MASFFVLRICATSFMVSNIDVLAGTSCTFAFDVAAGIGVYENIVYPTDTTND